jgi:AraC-like DNA-binding protein
MTGNCRLAVRMPASICTDYLGQQLHIPVQRRLEFYPGREGTRELPLVWRGMLTTSAGSCSFARSRWATSGCNASTGCCSPKCCSAITATAIPNRCAPRQRHLAPPRPRAREIIHDSVEETISIAALAAQVGVSVRSLQSGFRHFLGVTPLEYVRRHRLEKLHSALMESDGAASVTELMLECGIVNFGRYAQYYRQQYGCLLKRKRIGAIVAVLMARPLPAARSSS